MYSTHFSSTFWTVRTHGSIAFSFNDYCNDLLNERFDRYPSFSSSNSTSCCCCCCCSCCGSSYITCRDRVPLTPRLFYGLRQSSLIQRSPSRRVTLSGKGLCYYRVRDYEFGFDRDNYEVEETESVKIGSRIKSGRLGGRKSARSRCVGGVDDFDAVISLLCEDLSEDFECDEGSWSLSKRVETRRRERYGGEYSRERKKNTRRIAVSDSKNEKVSVIADAKAEGFRRKEHREEREEREETEVGLRVQHRRERKPSSSVSSYYSVTSDVDFENDEEGHNDYGNYAGESSSGYIKDVSTRDDRVEEKVHGQFKGGKVDSRAQSEAFELTTSTRTGAEWDLRKKSEKKLTEETSQVHSRLVKAHDEHKEAMNSHKQIDNEESKANLSTTFDKGTRKKYNHVDNQQRQWSEVKRKDEENSFRQDVRQRKDEEGPYGQDVRQREDEERSYRQDVRQRKDEESSYRQDLRQRKEEESSYRQDVHQRKDEESSYRQDMHGRKVESSFQSQKYFRDSKEDLSVDTNLIWKRRDEHQENVRENIERRNDTGIRYIGTERSSTLSMQSESRMNILEEDRRMSSVQEVNEQYNQTDEFATGQIESRVDTQQNPKTLESDTRRNLEGSVNVMFISRLEAEEDGQRAYRSPRRMHSGVGSQSVTNISMNVTDASITQATNIETSSIYHGPAGQTVTGQENESLIAKPTQETGGRNQTSGSFIGFESREEAGGSIETSRAQKKVSEEQSSNWVSKAGVQEVNVDDRVQRHTQEMMTPFSPQRIAQGPLYIGPRTETLSAESPGRASGSNSTVYTSAGGSSPLVQHEPSGREKRGDIHGKPTEILSREDALVSAQRLEESSVQFVGEFVEKARHELSTAETQKEETISGTKPTEVYKMTTEQGDSSELKVKLESRRSYGSSSVEGSSAEMWHVMDPAAQEPPQTEEPDISEATSDAVRRTGRSLWNVIADVVLLRWNSRAEAPKSTKKSGGKSSLTDSVSSETRCSGRDAEENSDNMKKERSASKEVSSSHQLKLKQVSTQVQGEASETFGIRNETGQQRIMSSSSSMGGKSGSWSTTISSPPGEENHNSSKCGQSSQAVSPYVETGESSSQPLPSGGVVSGTIVHDKVDIGTSGTVGGGFAGEIQEFSEKLVLESEEKRGELKCGRLQRSKQVIKDRFDDWEEAYLRESEQQKMDEMFMREALIEAKKAADAWEVPVGAVLVQHGEIVARGYNLVEELRDSTAHAEIICIREASKKLRTWRLSEATLYVTLEPCPMCAGAILQARIGTLVWGAPNKLLGADGSWIRLFPNGEGGDGMEQTDKPPAPVHPFHPKMIIHRGILASECADTMQQFFQLRRRKKEKDENVPPQPSCIPIAKHQPKILTKIHDIFHALLCM